MEDEERMEKGEKTLNPLASRRGRSEALVIAPKNKSPLIKRLVARKKGKRLANHWACSLKDRAYGPLKQG